VKHVAASLWLACGLARTSTAAAQERPRDEARAAFDEGMRGLVERRFHDAAMALERSYTLRPLPVVLYDLGLAYRGMGRYLAAIDAFSRYLANPDDATPERLAAITDEARELEGRLVHVDLTVSPDDTIVSVDGRTRRDASRAFTLDPGPHVIDCVRAGWRAARHELQGAPGERVAVSCALVALREGRLAVEASVASAAVWIDGRREGVGRVERALDPGDHRVEVRASGYYPFTRTVRVGPTGLSRLGATLQPDRRALVAGLAVTGGVLVASAIAVAIFYGLRAEPTEPYLARWGNVQESR
jgi:tetratricopeptide (TPR) repeat protein